MIKLWSISAVFTFLTSEIRHILQKLLFNVSCKKVCLFYSASFILWESDEKVSHKCYCKYLHCQESSSGVRIQPDLNVWEMTENERYSICHINDNSTSLGRLKYHK